MDAKADRQDGTDFIPSNEARPMATIIDCDFDHACSWQRDHDTGPLRFGFGTSNRVDRPRPAIHPERPQRYGFRGLSVSPLNQTS